MLPFQAPEPEIFRSPADHYRMRAEFRVWHDEDDLYHIMFDQQTKQRIRVEQFPVASRLINRLMDALMTAIRAEPLLRRKLFQIDYLSTLSGKLIASLLYHRQLDEEWQQKRWNCEISYVHKVLTYNSLVEQLKLKSCWITIISMRSCQSPDAR